MLAYIYYVTLSTGLEGGISTTPGVLTASAQGARIVLSKESNSYQGSNSLLETKIK